MNIALIAHDNKKELMVDLCIAYKAILQAFPICDRRDSFGYSGRDRLAGLPVHAGIARRHAADGCKSILTNWIW